MTDTTGFFRGEGSVVWEMTLPLHPDQEQKLIKGYLTRVNADGSKWEPPADEPAPAPDPPAPKPEPTPAPTPGQLEALPAVNASKAHWIGWLVRNAGVIPDDAEAMTKGDLMEAAKQHVNKTASGVA